VSPPGDCHTRDVTPPAVPTGVPTPPDAPSSPRESDAERLRALHDQHAPALWAYAVSLCGGDRARAQDVVQETLLRAWRTPDVLAQARGPVRGWLYTVARRLVIDEWRSGRARHEVVTDAVPERLRPDDEAEAVVNRRVVLDALRTLSPEHRAVLLECYFRGASVAEAAHTLGVAPGTVKSRTHYALRALRLALADVGQAPGGRPGAEGAR
jgi:RNA polymerase sigma-70 factor, ECF subfamily